MTAEVVIKSQTNAISTLGKGAMPPSSQKRDIAGSVYINLQEFPERKSFNPIWIYIIICPLVEEKTVFLNHKSNIILALKPMRIAIFPPVSKLGSS